MGAPVEIDAVLAACAGPAYPETGRMPLASERLTAMRTNAVEPTSVPTGPFAFATIRSTPWADRGWVPRSYFDTGPWGYGRLGPDADDTEIERLAPGVVQIRFDTAWSPPDHLVDIMAARFPGLLAIRHVCTEPGNGVFGDRRALWGQAAGWETRAGDAPEFDAWHAAHFGYVLTNGDEEEEPAAGAPLVEAPSTRTAEPGLVSTAAVDAKAGKGSADVEDPEDTEAARQAGVLRAVYDTLGKDPAGTLAACTAWVDALETIEDAEAIQRTADAFRRAHRLPPRAISHLLARHARVVPPSVLAVARAGDWDLVEVLAHRTPRTPDLAAALTAIGAAWLQRPRPHPPAPRLSQLHRAWTVLAAEGLLPADASQWLVAAAQRWARPVRPTPRSLPAPRDPADRAQAVVELAEVAMTIPTLTAVERTALLACVPSGDTHALIRSMLVHHATVTGAEAAILLGLAPAADGTCHAPTRALWQAVRRDLAWWADPARRALLLDPRAPDEETLLAGAESYAERGDPAEAAVRIAAAIQQSPQMIAQLTDERWARTCAHLPVSALAPALIAEDGGVRQCAVLLSSRCGTAVPRDEAPSESPVDARPPVDLGAAVASPRTKRRSR